MPTLIRFAFAAAVWILTFINANALPSRDEREILMAEHEFFYATLLALNASPDGRPAYQSVHDFQVNAADMALALIASKKTGAGDSALVSLIQFRLDGALGEDFDCYVLQSGKRLLPKMRKIAPAALFEACKTTVLDAYEKNREVLDIDKSMRLCAQPEEMRRNLNALSEGIKKKTKCSDGDF